MLENVVLMGLRATSPFFFFFCYLFYFGASRVVATVKMGNIVNGQF
ncbi:hypothetical protein CsSME_00023076 [Camellia sinensis var. sinensis]